MTTYYILQVKVLWKEFVNTAMKYLVNRDGSYITMSYIYSHSLIQAPFSIVTMTTVVPHVKMVYVTPARRENFGSQ